MVLTIRILRAGRFLLLACSLVVFQAASVSAAPQSYLESEEPVWSPARGIELMDLDRDPVRGSAGGELRNIGERLLEGPDTLFERMALFSRGVLSRWENSDVGARSGITRRLTEFTIEPRSEDVLSAFLESWKARNLRYFARFGEAEIYTPGFEAEFEDIEIEGLAREESKMAWDALQDAYFSRYDFAPDRTLRHDAWRFESWKGIDFLVLPPLMLAYLYYRGLDRTFKISGSELRVEVDPMSTWIRDDDPASEVSAIWTPFKDSPAGVIGVATFRPSEVDVEFVGVGTSLSEVRKALSLQKDP